MGYKHIYIYIFFFDKENRVVLIEVGHAIVPVSVHLATRLPQESHMSDRPQSLHRECAPSRVSKAP